MGTFIDFTGQRFGSLVVVSFAEIRKKRTYWHCKCDCGMEKDVWQGRLRNTKSCGKKDCMSLTNKNDLSGQKFGWLNAIKYEIRKGWLCKCDCGNFMHTKAWSLTSGFTKSCGCKTSEMNALFHTLPNNDGLVNHLYRRYKDNAKNRDLEFDLSISNFRKFIFDNCFYCGSPPAPCSLKRKFSENNANGIDRKDNVCGYILENSITCCFICNRAKNSMDYEDFISWLDQIVSHRKKE
jgi:hypothetical protein